MRKFYRINIKEFIHGFILGLLFSGVIYLAVLLVSSKGG